MTREEAIAILQGRQKEIAEDIFILIEHRKRIHEALDMAIEALSANYTTVKPKDAVAEPTDLISRADAIEAVENLQTEQWIDSDIDYNNGLGSAVAEINALPSADRPSGEWVIRENGNKECSLCGHERQDGWDYFCGYCGAKMGSDTR